MCKGAAAAQVLLSHPPSCCCLACVTAAAPAPDDEPWQRGQLVQISYAERLLQHASPHSAAVQQCSRTSPSNTLKPLEPLDSPTPFQASSPPILSSPASEAQSRVNHARVLPIPNPPPCRHGLLPRTRERLRSPIGCSGMQPKRHAQPSASGCCSDDDERCIEHGVCTGHVCNGSAQRGTLGSCGCIGWRRGFVRWGLHRRCVVVQGGGRCVDDCVCFGCLRAPQWCGHVCPATACSLMRCRWCPL